MKISEKWLREWVNPKLKREALGNALTMAGFEVEEIAPVAGNIEDVCVVQVIRVEKHPEADRLSICEVDGGGNNKLTIVCGAPNVRAGMKAALANTPPKAIRGITSEGMLCSSAELGLSDDNDGLIELDEKAKIGMDLRKHLDLDDYTFVIAVMPDRGDCLSVRGMAREISAITHTKFTDLKIKAIKPTIKDTLKIKLSHKKGCPHYVGRIIRNVNANAPTPVWLKEKLRRVGARSISAIVDVTNYVLFELGQPMHAFDLNKIDHHIHVRHAHAGEKIKLLDDSEQILTDETMVIADQEQPLAIAGVMGGVDSSVTPETTDVFLESAYFSPAVISKQRQYFNINSDSSYRFERGVDPTLQKMAMERATQLILEICGGKAGPVIEETIAKNMPKRNVVSLTNKKVEQVLGITIPDKTISQIFNSLHFDVKHTKGKWTVKVPPYRFDITLPEDLVEEVGRLYGFDKIPEKTISGELTLPSYGQNNDYQSLRQTLNTLGYHEIVSYSFIEETLQKRLDPDRQPEKLLNPITADMTVMRTNLWPGLLNTLVYNRARQQHRVRLFEIGTCFIREKTDLQQLPRLAGLISGSALPESWGNPRRQIDFYDLKGDLEILLRTYTGEANLDFIKTTHPALHPGQTAAITYGNQEIGIIGALNPNLMQACNIEDSVFLFEIDLDELNKPRKTEIREISKFPEIRRDIAILVNEAVPSKEIQDTIRNIAGDWLKDVFIFDVYKGKGISPGRKSIALGLVIQHPTRTLVDDEVTELMERVISSLKGKLGAELRS